MIFYFMVKLLLLNFNTFFIYVIRFVGKSLFFRKELQGLGFLPSKKYVYLHTWQSLALIRNIADMKTNVSLSHNTGQSTLALKCS